ncbi:MAG: phosphatidylserine decarboxylase [Synergistetes bacterium]|nr:phosphatidylserine decarboxylase [Synergistota bacterium]
MFSLAPEGRRIIYAFLIIASVISMFSPWLSLPFWFVFLGLLYFFRDPDRVAPCGEEVIVSPADGKIIEISDTFEGRFLNAPSKKISIFMSLLDVHVNRAPLDGKVVYKEYVPGAKKVAFAPKTSEINERSYLGLRGRVPVLLVQIAGFVARRIVTYPEEGDYLRKGERFGIIKLGSRVDLYLPPHVSLLVREGDKVKAGETVLGVVIENEKREMAYVSNER